METRAPAVVAVVVTTAPGPGLEATLASLAAQDYGELSVLVVANGDDAHVVERVASVAPAAFVRVLAENRGFAAACNEASLMVEGSAFFLFCHDDVRLAPDAVQRLVESAFRTNAGVVAPKVVSYEDRLVLVHVGQTCDRFGVVQERLEPGEIDDGQQDLERDVFVAPGGVTLVRSDLFATLEGFDPLIIALGEDLDLCWRAQLAGARIVVAPAAVVAHRESLARGERLVSAIGVGRASRQDLQRRHRLMVVATGGHRRTVALTLTLLAAMEVMELVVAVAGRDTDRAGAIVGSWRWVARHRAHLRHRRRQREATRVLSDAQLRRLQEGGATRLRRFLVTLVRDGLDRARGILPPPVPSDLDDAEAGVGFAAAFAGLEEFDEIPENPRMEERRRPSRLLTTFRSQATVVVLALALWAIGSRNLVAMPLPLIGRLAPLDSWWTTWRHLFATWSSSGLGSGSPGSPGYGVLAAAGTFVLGRMGILPRVMLIGAAPVGAWGVARLLGSRVSNRARLVAALAYLALPVGITMISQGRVDVLVAVAGLPFVVRRVFELLGVTGYPAAPYGAPVAFGARGWRTTASGQRLVAVMLVAVLCAMAPATLVAVVLVVVGVVVARLFDRADRARSRPGRTLVRLVVGVAVLLAPLSVDVVIAGRRALDVFGLARGPWSAPGFSQLLRGVDGGFGGSWLGWLLPAAAAIGLLLARGPRRVIASRLATIAVIDVVVADLAARHWMGSFAPDLDVLLALYAVMLAALVGLGLSAVEVDLRDVSFGWRQLGAGVLVVVTVVGLWPLLASVGSGRFDLPTSSVAQSMSALAPADAGGYRVLWLGDPSVVPLAGWPVAPGLELATSLNGLPGGANLFAAPDTRTSGVLVNDVALAMQGRTVHLGALLAEAGVATIVVMNSAAPELAGVQSAPLSPAPGALVTALSRQTDLSLELQTRSVAVYGDSLFHGVVARAPSPGAGWAPLRGELFAPAPVTSGASVVAALAPAGDFALDVNGTPTPRTLSDGWAPTFQVGTYHQPPGSTITARVVLDHLPWNGLLALVTLLLWALAGLAFSGLYRVSWFTRRRGHSAGRHVKGGADGA